MNRPSVSSTAARVFKGVLEKTLLHVNASRLRVYLNMPCESWKVMQRRHDQILPIRTTERPRSHYSSSNRDQYDAWRTPMKPRCLTAEPTNSYIMPLNEPGNAYLHQNPCRNLSTNLPPKPSTRRTRCCVWPTANRIIHFPKYTDWLAMVSQTDRTCRNSEKVG
jgi:hypothetical protein